MEVAADHQVAHLPPGSAKDFCHYPAHMNGKLASKLDTVCILAAVLASLGWWLHKKQCDLTDATIT